jgi:DNA-binding CsgD family transcriptional regulator/signal peptidase I
MPKENPYKKLASLSPRQKEVLQLLCQGKQYKEIAEALFIEESTVKAHMAGVYKKLGLIELKRDERIFQIKSIYCPMLQEGEKPETFEELHEDIVDESEPEEIDEEPETNEIDDESEPEELTPEMDEMISSDEKAIIKFEGEKISMPTKYHIEKEKKSGIGKFFRKLFVLIILVVIVGGGLFVWQNFFGGPEVIPSEMIQKEYYDVGEWVKLGDVWLRIKDYDIDNMGLIEIDIEIWNKSPNKLLFSYNPGISFRMTDNTGHRYKLSGPYDISAMDNEVIDAQDVRKINFKATASTVAFYDEAVFSADVTDLYLAMSEFAVFKNVKFIIPIR